ncbi:MAG TPA: glycerate kinase [Sporichthyaceae bacterium]|nr:glycerate kinase [Sporichthyaceae bacterium]
MRVLIAPDSFGGTLTAVEAAEAIAAGWRTSAPDDELVLAPLSDGGPGFIEVVRAATGGRLLAHRVTGPMGEPVVAGVLLVDEIAYVESAQACGLHLVPIEARDPMRTTTFGVGELLDAAIGAGARRVLVGLGGSATNDGGAGALAALGARPADVLRAGGGALAGLDPAALDLSAARDRLADVDLRIATDVDNVLLGIRGASAGFGPQKGADPDAVQRLDAALERFARAAQPEVGLNMPGSAAVERGSGAAGGLGFGLMLLGARRISGIATVAEIVGLFDAVADADVVISGEGCFDWQSLAGKVVSGVAAVAGQFGRPCLVLAGRVEVGRREMATLGVAGAYAILEEDQPQQVRADHAAADLAALAARVARNWSSQQS